MAQTGCPITLDDALASIHAGQHEIGLERLTHLVNDSPDRRAALGHRAWLFRALGRYEEAIRDYESLRNCDPTDSNAAALMAETYLLLNQPRRAIGLSIEVLQTDPLNLLATQVISLAQLALTPKTRAECKYHQPLDDTAAGPFNRTIDALKQYAPHLRATIDPVVAGFLYWTTRILKPRQAIEIGSYIGYSSLYIGQALKDGGGGRLHSFDLFQPKTGLSLPFPELKNAEDSLFIARTLAEKAGLSDFITYYRGDSSVKIIQTFDPSTFQADLVFIDGDHRIRGVIKDWEAIDRLLPPGGFAILHDTEPRECGWMGPRYLLENLDPRRYHYVNFPTPGGIGLAIVRKLGQRESFDWRPSLRELFSELLLHRVFGWKESRQGPIPSAKSGKPSA